MNTRALVVGGMVVLAGSFSVIALTTPITANVSSNAWSGTGAPLQCDLSKYTASSGLAAAVEQDVLTVSWTGSGSDELRARYGIAGGTPVVRELAVRKRMLSDFNTEIGAGLGPLKGKIWRIGLMGVNADKKNINACLSALCQILNDSGRKTNTEAVLAAIA